MVSFYSLKLSIKYKLIDYKVKNIQLTQNLICTSVNFFLVKNQPEKQEYI